jgi:hypothetical protein
MTEDDIEIIDRDIENESGDEDNEDSVDTQEQLTYNKDTVSDNTASVQLPLEEKILIESMARLYNSLSSEYERDNDDEQSEK